MRIDVRTYLAPLIFGNTGNLGLPLALFAFGETGLGYAVVVFAVMAFKMDISRDRIRDDASKAD